jgi:hypothetical protein
MPDLWPPREEMPDLWPTETDLEAGSDRAIAGAGRVTP